MPVEKDQEREDRIHDEAIVDAYGSEERSIGWYYYLDDRITFPFQAKCLSERKISPLKAGEEIEVIEMSPADDCEHDMRVQIRFLDRTLGVPLVQLSPLDVNEQTQEAVEDWHYWVARGYMF